MQPKYGVSRPHHQISQSKRALDTQENDGVGLPLFTLWRRLFSDCFLSPKLKSFGDFFSLGKRQTKKRRKRNLPERSGLLEQSCGLCWEQNYHPFSQKYSSLKNGKKGKHFTLRFQFLFNIVNTWQCAFNLSRDKF